MDRDARPLFFAPERYNARVFSYELTCRCCGWRTVCGVDDAIARLRLFGLLRRDREPDDDLVAALFVESAPRMTCPICKEKRLAASPSDISGADDQWQAVVLCEVCRTPIPLERLDAVPDTKRCAKCQGLAELDKLPDAEPDFCPHCGALVEVRVSRGSGITRYKRVCTGSPPCRL
jgi:rubrerythrin